MSDTITRHAACVIQRQTKQSSDRCAVDHRRQDKGFSTTFSWNINLKGAPSRAVAGSHILDKIQKYSNMKTLAMIFACLALSAIPVNSSADTTR